MDCARLSRERLRWKNCYGSQNRSVSGEWYQSPLTNTMLLGFLTIAITLALAYAYYREGLFTAFTMFCNVFLGGLIAFNFWEPLAALLEPILAGTFLRGYE